MWGLLNSGGRLVYATCSILPAENEDIIAEFLAATPDAVIKPIEAEWGLAQQYGRQVLPGMDAMDGFYYAVLEKQ